MQPFSLNGERGDWELARSSLGSHAPSLPGPPCPLVTALVEEWTQGYRTGPGKPGAGPSVIRTGVYDGGCESSLLLKFSLIYNKAAI